MSIVNKDKYIFSVPPSCFPEPFASSPYPVPPPYTPPGWSRPRPSPLLRLLRHPPAISWDGEPLYRGEEAVRLRSAIWSSPLREESTFPSVPEYELEVGGEWFRVQRLLIPTVPRVGEDPGVAFQERYDVVVDVSSSFYLIRLEEPGTSHLLIKLTAYGPFPSLAEAEDLAVKLRGEP